MKVLSVFGTRPEAIKMAPVVKALESDERFVSKVCVTGQHREMLHQVLSLFSIVPDHDLNVMSVKQDINSLTCLILQGLKEVLEFENPDLILVHGDTTTTLAASLVGYYQKVRVCHVEAGLRTGDIFSPWPEEVNRRVAAIIAERHFAPTIGAAQNLMSEGVSDKAIVVTGNTVIDALLSVVEKIKSDRMLAQSLDKQFSFLEDYSDSVLITCHRRESFGEGFQKICEGIKRAAALHEDVGFIFPVHLNPNVREPVYSHLTGIPNIYLLDPLDYLPFVYLMYRCKVILTDSGGIQEEAPAMGKPVLVLRDKTERPEAVSAGTVKLVGTNPDKILEELSALLVDDKEYFKMSFAHNPFGDGHAAEIIKENLLKI